MIASAEPGERWLYCYVDDAFAGYWRPGTNVNDKDNSATGTANPERSRQREGLRQKEPELQRLAAEKNKKEFFRQILPLLRPLQSYIKRRLRIAYDELEIRTPVATSGDILDEVVLEAYNEYANQPQNLSLEQWLYQIANRKLDNYLSKQKKREKRRASLETLSQSELRTLEEMPITADVEGEPWLPEDLDDSEFQPREIKSPADDEANPEAMLERKEQLQRIFDALCRLPERERLVFDLVVLEGFSKESAAKILGLSGNDVSKLLDRARAQLRAQLEAQSRLRVNTRAKAS